MADQNLNFVGCLGRVLTFVGVVWIAIIVLGGVGLLSRAGAPGELLAGIAGVGIIPGLILLGLGRAIRRRARAMGGKSGSTPVPDQLHTESGRVPSIRLERTPTPTPTPSPTPIPVPPVERTPPKPVQPRPRPVDPIVKARRDVAKSVEGALSGLEEPEESNRATETSGIGSDRPKTSQELVDEARRRWGGDKPR